MLKKVLALAIAGAMVLGSMSAFGAAGDLTTDAKISITGLADGDIVTLYKVLEWTDGTGWTKTIPFSTVDTAGLNNLVANQKGVELTAADLQAIATATAGLTSAEQADQQTVSGTTYTYNAGTQEKAGMYIALVTAKNAGTVYNPIIISADFLGTNSTNTIDSSALIGTSDDQEIKAVAKRKDVTVEKTEPKITNDVGDTYEYTVKTIIPVYSDAFTDQFFKVSDALSENLTLDQSSIKIDDQTVDEWAAATVSGAASTTDYELTPAEHGFTLELKHGFVSKLAQATEITITYKAKLTTPLDQLTNVTEENNEITVEFPNNPNDLSGKKVTALKDGTKEYTFTIDGKLFGNSDWQTAELVKVGLDANNSPIEAVINVSNGSKHAALAGAVFGLFTSDKKANDYNGDGTEPADSAAAAAAGLYYNDVFKGIVVTDSMGLMNIPGLDVGTYYLKELDAPSGYIKDQAVHTITITADINGDGKDANGNDAVETGEAVTEYYTVDANGKVTWSKTQAPGSTPYTYYVPVLNSYTVTIDGNKVGEKSSVYNMTLSGPSISKVTPAESSTDIVNTQGVELPSTGGIGTTLFYAGGAVLVLLAGVLLVSKRRIA